MKKILGILSITILIVGVALAAHAAPYQDVYGPPDILLFGSEYSDISGIRPGDEQGWYLPSTGEGPIVTNWQGQWVEYTGSLVPGNWNIGINIIQPYVGALPPPDKYLYFEVRNSATGETMYIEPSETEVNHGFVNLDIGSSGDYTVRYTWLNDYYWGGYDANIKITEAFFDYNPVPIPGALILLGSGLVGLVGIRRKITG